MTEARKVDSAVVLAAGRGTRLGDLTAEIPKPMLDVGGMPLLEHSIRALAGIGIRRVAMVIGYLGEQIREHFGDGSKWGLEITYHVQAVRNGTAAALLLGRPTVEGHPFVLLWGDILVRAENYAHLVDRYASTDADLVLAIQKVAEPHKGGAVVLDGDGRRIEQIIEKPPPGTVDTEWINAGIGVFGPDAFHYLEKVEPSPRAEYEIPDAIRAMIADEKLVLGEPLEGEWIDIGTPEDLTRARKGDTLI